MEDLNSSYANSIPFYIGDLSICGFGYGGRSWNQSRGTAIHILMLNPNAYGYIRGRARHKFQLSKVLTFCYLRCRLLFTIPVSHFLSFQRSVAWNPYPLCSLDRAPSEKISSISKSLRPPSSSPAARRGTGYKRKAW